MTKEELAGGIRNALDHGATLDQAIASFISAGYNETEVREAGRSFSSSVSTLTAPETPKVGTKVDAPRGIPANKDTQSLAPLPALPSIKSDAVKPAVPQTPSISPKPAPQPSTPPGLKPLSPQVLQQPVKKKSSKKLLIISLIIFVLVLIGAVIAIALFQDPIIEYLSS